MSGPQRKAEVTELNDHQADEKYSIWVLIKQKNAGKCNIRVQLYLRQNQKKYGTKEIDFLSCLAVGEIINDFLFYLQASLGNRQRFPCFR